MRSMLDLLFYDDEELSDSDISEKEDGRDIPHRQPLRC